MSENVIGQDSLAEGKLLRKRYKILKVIGKGGFGVTYKAVDTFVDVPVAIKQFYNSREGVEKEALQEAKIAAGFYDLEGVAAARDYFVEDGSPYIVMDYVQGISVTKYVKQNGHMDGIDVLKKMRPIMLSLAKVHKKGVIHRDISADNLMITKEGKFILVDFGAARFTSQYYNKSHTVMFKRGFAPIEQCRENGEQGPATDIYSLCATIYFMITGMVPDDAIERMIDDKQKSLTEIFGTGLSDKAKNAIMKGLAVKAEERYQSIAELYAELYGQSIDEEENELLLFTQSPEKEPGNTTFLKTIHKFVDKNKKAKRQKIIILSVVTLLLLLVGVGIYMIFGHRTEDVVPETTRMPVATAMPTTMPTTAPTYIPTKEPEATPVVTAKPTDKPKPTASPTKKPKKKVKPTPRATQKPTPKPKKKKVDFSGDLDGL